MFAFFCLRSLSSFDFECAHGSLLTCLANRGKVGVISVRDCCWPRKKKKIDRQRSFSLTLPSFVLLGRSLTVDLLTYLLTFNESAEEGVKKKISKS